MIAQKLSHVGRSVNNIALQRVAKFSSSTPAFGAAGGHDDHHHHAHPVKLTINYYMHSFYSHLWLLSFLRSDHSRKVLLGVCSWEPWF